MHKSGALSRNELLEKWKVEKGRPPKADKPWMPVGLTRGHPLTNADFQSAPQLPGTINSSRSKVNNEATKQQQDLKPVHTNFLKRRSGMLKWANFGLQEHSKRRRTICQTEGVLEKENVKVEPINRTLSCVKLDSGDGQIEIKKTRRERLRDWKNMKLESCDRSSTSCAKAVLRERVEATVVVPRKRRASPDSFVKQTATMPKKCKELREKNADVFKVPLDATTSRKTSEILRRQTMTIRKSSTPLAEENTLSLKTKKAPIPTSTSQLNFKKPSSKEIASKRGIALSGKEKLSTLRRSCSSDVSATAPANRNAIGVPFVRSTRTSLLRNPETNQAIASLKKDTFGAKPTATIAHQRRPTSVSAMNKTYESQSQKSLSSATKPKIGLVVLPKSKAAKKNVQINSEKPDSSHQQMLRPISPDACAKTVMAEQKSCMGILKSKSTLKTPVRNHNVAFEVSIDDSPCKDPVLRRRLSSWLKERGRSPSAYRHLHCFGVEPCEKKKSAKSRSLSNLPCLGTPKNTDIDDSSNLCNTLLAGRTPLGVLNSETLLSSKSKNRMSAPLIKAPEETVEKESVEVERMSGFVEALADLKILLENSYSPREASEWLDAMYEDTQNVRQLAGYWECRSKVSEMNNDVFEAVALVEEGIACDAKPTDVLLTIKEQLLNKSENVISAFTTTTPKRRLGTNNKNVFSSTLIHYMVQDKTPIYQKMFREFGGENMARVTVTPVRRTHRKSSGTTPGSVSRRTMMHCISSLDDLPDELKRRMILVPNPSLKFLLESPLNSDDKMLL